ncbi:MAG: hypothetical protein SGPRY_000699 [Prymnesium sp.]
MMNPSEEEAVALKKELQAELMAVKKRWGEAIKLTKAKPDAPNAPLPVGVLRIIERPSDAFAYDVEELKIRLWIDGLDAKTLPIRVEAISLVPQRLMDLISEHVLARWKAELQARGGSKGWLMEKVLGWCESAYLELITLEPSFLETYEGCDDNGMTIRRFAITEPPEPNASESESEEESEEEVRLRPLTVARLRGHCLWVYQLAESSSFNLIRGLKHVCRTRQKQITPRNKSRQCDSSASRRQRRRKPIGNGEKSAVERCPAQIHASLQHDSKSCGVICRLRSSVRKPGNKQGFQKRSSRNSWRRNAISREIGFASRHVDVRHS